MKAKAASSATATGFTARLNRRQRTRKVPQPRSPRRWQKRDHAFFAGGCELVGRKSFVHFLPCSALVPSRGGRGSRGNKCPLAVGDSAKWEPEAKPPTAPYQLYFRFETTPQCASTEQRAIKGAPSPRSGLSSSKLSGSNIC